MDFKLPELGEGVYEAEMSRWLVKEGDQVKPGAGLLEVLTDKATMEVPAPFAGTITSFKVKEGQKLKIGDTVLVYEESAMASAPVAAGPPASVTAAAGPVLRQTSSSGVSTAPSVRLLARQLGLDIAKVKGSGPGGRVLVEDLTNGSQTSGPKKAAAADQFGTPGTRIKYQGVRRMIAEHMVESTHSIPHYTYVDEFDATALVQARDGLRANPSKEGPKISYLAFLVKAVVQALKEVPLVNASLDEVAGEIVLHDVYHIGIAVATPSGLLVPVVHDADRLSLMDIAREIDRLSADARAGQAKRDDQLGGTFTITSIGNLGGLFATPIIHLPQVAILGIGKIVKRPVFDNHGQIRAADMVYLSFSFDHRVLDGAIGTAFGNAVMQHLKNPILLAV